MLEDTRIYHLSLCNKSITVLGPNVKLTNTIYGHRLRLIIYFILSLGAGQKLSKIKPHKPILIGFRRLDVYTVIFRTR